ncbi:MAG: hypothetical protein AB7P02_07840 [Alphaproteobacteria bacterium]
MAPPDDGLGPAAALRGRAASVLRGRTGRLFYEHYEGASLAAIADAAELPHALAFRWRRILQTRARLLRRRGLRQHILLAPDAHCVFRDELPHGVTVASPSPGARFAAIAAGIDGLTVIDPEPSLVAARGGLDVFHANDTHWSGFGARIAYDALMAALPAGLTQGRLSARDVVYRFRRAYGDMGALVEPEMAVEHAVPEVPGRNPVRAFRRAAPTRDNWTRVACADGTGRAMVAGDSFLVPLIPFLAASFARTDLLAATARLHPEIVDAEKPDAVVLQMATRRIAYPPDDHRAETAWEIFAQDSDSPAAAATSAAFADRAEGRTEAAIGCLRAAAHAGDHPALRFHAAALLQEEGRFAESEPELRAGLAQRDDRPALWHLLNIALRHLGRPREALDASARAVALLPDNGLYASHHGYNLLAAGRAADAVAAMNLCRRDVSDCEALCYWLAQARLRAGDAAGAMGDAVDCLLLAPGHAKVPGLLAAIRDRME